MKRIALFALLIALTLFELFLCTAFLPVSWQHALNDRIASLFSASGDMTPTTHPLLSAEIDQVLRENLPLRIFLYAVTLGLLLINTLVIRFVWRRLRAAASPASADPEGGSG